MPIARASSRWGKSDMCATRQHRFGRAVARAGIVARVVATHCRVAKRWAVSNAAQGFPCHSILSPDAPTRDEGIRRRMRMPRKALKASSLLQRRPRARRLIKARWQILATKNSRISRCARHTFWVLCAPSCSETWLVRNESSLLVRHSPGCM